MKKIALLTLAACLAMSPAYADIDNMDIGGSIMAEYFFSSELVGTDSETDFLRTEGMLWFQADLDDNVMARISIEFDRAMDSSQGWGRNDLAASSFGGFDNLDLFLEEAFVKVADIAGSGFTFTVGRQFLNFGDDPNADNFNRWWGPGFVISDSDPMSPGSLAQLGSYEIDPFDAVVVSYEMEDFAISGIYARTIEDYDSFVNDDSAVTALYGSYFGIEGHQIDQYVAWEDNNIGSSNTLVFGGRASGDITPDFAYKAEVAYQMDDDNLNPAAEVEGLAIQAGINYHPEFEYNPNIGLLYTFLEGDNGDGPRFMDGKTYGLLADSFAWGQLTNAHVFNLNGGFEPMESVAWTADLYYIIMDDDLPVTNDDDGGFEVDSQIDYRFNDNLTTFLGGGVYFIGDAYGRDDEAYFFRTGLKVAF